MSDFQEAMKFLLPHERGYADSVHDAGGATKYGISLRFLLTINPSATKETIKNLTIADAYAIYRKHFWDKYNVGSIKSQKIANKIFDMYVNMAPKASGKVIQTAINNTGDKEVSVDGVMGNATINAVNDINENKLLPQIKLSAIAHYLAIVDFNIAELPNFRSWIRRALNG